MKTLLALTLCIVLCSAVSAAPPSAAEQERRIAELEQVVADLQWQVADQAETIHRQTEVIDHMKQEREIMDREWWAANNAAAHWLNSYVKCFQEKLVLIEKLQRLGYSP